MTRPLPDEVRTWPRWAQELMIERAGMALDSGASPALADQVAVLEVKRRMREGG